MAVDLDLQYFLQVRDASLDYLDKACGGKLKVGYYMPPDKPKYKDASDLSELGLSSTMRLVLRNDFNKTMAGKFSRWSPASPTDMNESKLIGSFIVISCKRAGASIFADWIGIKVGA